MMRTRPRKLLTAAALTASTVVTACGGDSGEGNPKSSFYDSGVYDAAPIDATGNPKPPFYDAGAYDAGRADAGPADASEHHDPEPADPATSR